MPSTARHTTPCASARLAEAGPSRAPRLSCVLEDLESGATRTPQLAALYRQLETTEQRLGEHPEREAA